MYKFIICGLVLIMAIQCTSAQCSKLHGELVTNIVKFIQCFSKHDNDGELCRLCFFEQKDMLTAYDTLVNTSQTYASAQIQCRNLYFGVNQLDVFQKIYDGSISIWNDAQCSYCIKNDKFSNEAVSVLNQTDEVNKCFNTTIKTDICTTCSPKYHTLNKMYENLLQNGSTCFDVYNQVNLTQQRWSRDFDCTENTRKTSSNLALLIVGGIILFIIPLFYGSFFIYQRRRNRYATLTESDIPAQQNTYGSQTTSEVPPAINQNFESQPGTSHTREAPESSVSIKKDKSKLADLTDSDDDDDDMPSVNLHIDSRIKNIKTEDDDLLSI